jgi:hypothetical protein
MGRAGRGGSAAKRERARASARARERERESREGPGEGGQAGSGTDVKKCKTVASGEETALSRTGNSQKTYRMSCAHVTYLKTMFCRAASFAGDGAGERNGAGA